jgi:hypothetical protein
MKIRARAQYAAVRTPISVFFRREFSDSLWRTHLLPELAP